jgi:hypothetical protein
MAGASGPALGLGPGWAASEPNLSVDSRRAGCVEVAVGTGHVGRQRSILREGGYERGVGADDCFSSGGERLTPELGDARLRARKEERPALPAKTAGALELHGKRERLG